MWCEPLMVHSLAPGIAERATRMGGVLSYYQGSRCAADLSADSYAMLHVSVELAPMKQGCMRPGNASRDSFTTQRG